MNSIEEEIINLIKIEINKYVDSTNIKIRKSKSQFFTDSNIAEKMTDLLSDFDFNKKKNNNIGTISWFWNVII